MSIPPWLILGVAIMVILFGSYRIFLAVRPRRDEPETKPRRGFYGMTRRTQLLVGVIYLLLGGALIATTYGWNPLGDTFGKRSPSPSSGPAPQEILLEKKK